MNSIWNQILMSLKFWFSEKSTKIWHNLPFSFDVTYIFFVAFSLYLKFYQLYLSEKDVMFENFVFPKCVLILSVWFFGVYNLHLIYCALWTYLPVVMLTYIYSHTLVLGTQCSTPIKLSVSQMIAFLFPIKYTLCMYIVYNS